MPLQLYPLVSELAADGIPVAVTCRVLNIARQPYYRWRADPVTATERGEAYRANALFDAHREDPEFGYRFLADEARSAGEPMVDRTAWRICSANKWWSAFGKKRGAKYGRSGPPVHDDLVGRVFTAEDPNRLWLTDITEHRTDEGKLYMCAIKDLYSNRIVGYSIGDRMKSRLAVAALESAVSRRGPVAGCVVHSDRGSQGGFNRSSQHLDHRGAQWDVATRRYRRRRQVPGGSGRRTERCDLRCVPQVGPNPRVRCSVTSGGGSHQE